MDGTGFTNDYADKYYAKIRNKERKSYVKYHTAIDVETRLIFNHLNAALDTIQILPPLQFEE